MAARNKRPGLRGGIVTDNIPECPICLEPLAAPIYQCMSGHDICESCSQNLRPYICPVCREPMTRSRNEGLEKAINAAKMPCPNNEAGCIYTPSAKAMDDHLKECIYRQYNCPLGLAGHGNCPWTGKRSDMLDHFRDRHPSHCNISPDTDINLKHVSLTENNSHLRLASLDRLLFVIIMKIDAVHKMAYFTVQHFGTKTIARQHNYKIEVTSKLDSRRKVIFNEICQNDTTSLDEIIREGKCGVVSLAALNQFVVDNQLSFKYYITKQINEPGKKFDNEIGNRNDEDNPGPKGPFPNYKGPRSNSKGPDTRSAEFRGAGPKRGTGYKGHMKTKKFAAK